MMKIVVIHGQSHRGVTYHMTYAVLNHIRGPKDIQEFFLPTDGPDCCVGCNQCFLQGEAHCPQADKVQPIMTAMEEADLIVLTSPNYCMEMSGAMKVLLDHFAYRWVTHRPHGAMFTKVGLTVSSSAGAPASHTTKSLAKQLRWMGVAKRYQFPLVCHAMGVQALDAKTEAKIDRTAQRLAKQLERRVAHPKPSLVGKAMFAMFRKMQAGEAAAWNPTDRQWWVDQGWLDGKKPWKEEVR